MPIGTPTGAEYTGGTTGVTTRTCPVPTGISDGDLIIAYAALSQDDTAATGITVTAGTWQSTVFANNESVVGMTCVLWRTWRTGDPTTYTFGKSGSTTSSSLAVVMVRVPGGSATLSVNPTAIDQTAVGTSVNCTAATVPSGLPSNALVVRFFHTYYYSASKVNTDTWLPPSGYTELCDQSDDWISIGAAVLSRSAGTEAAATATAGGSQSGARGRGVTLVVAPTADLPTLVNTYPAVASSATATTASFTPQAGELLVIKAATGSASSVTISSVSSTYSPSLTFTSIIAVTTASQCAMRVWTAPVPATPGSAITVSVTFSTYSSSIPAGFVVERWSLATGTSNINSTRTASTAAAPSTTLTTAKNSSMVTTLCADFNGTASSGTAAYRSSATQNYIRQVAGIGMYSFTQPAATAGSQTIGMTSPSQKWTMVGLELQYSATGTLTPAAATGSFFHVLAHHDEEPDSRPQEPLWLPGRGTRLRPPRILALNG